MCYRRTLVRVLFSVSFSSELLMPCEGPNCAVMPEHWLRTVDEVVLCQSGHAEQLVSGCGWATGIRPKPSPSMQIAFGLVAGITGFKPSMVVRYTRLISHRVRKWALYCFIYLYRYGLQAFTPQWSWWEEEKKGLYYEDLFCKSQLQKETNNWVVAGLNCF